MGGMSTDNSPVFKERLWPSPLLLLTMLLFVPAVMMIVFPLNPTIAIPVAIAFYLIVAGSLVLMSPTIVVSNGTLQAGNAKIPVALLGKTTELDQAALRRIIGTEADARAYLVVRGHIHRGIKIDVLDENDPTPYWVLTSRKPRQLAAVIEATK